MWCHSSDLVVFLKEGTKLTVSLTLCATSYTSSLKIYHFHFLSGKKNPNVLKGEATCQRHMLNLCMLLVREAFYVPGT